MTIGHEKYMFFLAAECLNAGAYGLAGVVLEIWSCGERDTRSI